MNSNPHGEHPYAYAKAWAILLQAENVDGVMELVNERAANEEVPIPLDTPNDYLAYIIDEAKTLELNYSADAEIRASAREYAAALCGYAIHLRALGVMPSLLPWQRVRALLERAEEECGLLRMLARRVTITDDTSVEVIHGILAHAEQYVGGSGVQIEAAHIIARRIIELGYSETPQQDSAIMTQRSWRAPSGCSLRERSAANVVRREHDELGSDNHIDPQLIPRARADSCTSGSLGLNITTCGASHIGVAQKRSTGKKEGTYASRMGQTRSVFSS